MPRTLDRRAFIQLTDTVTTYAIENIAREWESTKQAVDQDELSATVEREHCQCEILLRYSLPCRHYLQDVYRNGQPIPRSLIHPRWWINSPVIQYTNWRPTINIMTLPISPPRNQVTHSAQRFLDFRETLSGEVKARADQAMVQVTDDVIRFARQAKEESLLPTEMPEKVKKPGWHKQLKAHDKTARRSMTLVEQLERSEVEQPPEVPPKLPLDGDDDDDDAVLVQDLEPPCSTASPALINKKRARKHTTVYREAFGDSQDDPTAGIKRGKAGGLL